MRIILAGGTGFIGCALRESLAQAGHEVVILTRQRPRENQPGVRTRYRYWNPSSAFGREGSLWESEIEGVDAVINLAGEPIVGRRWTPAQKKKIVESRTNATRAIVNAIQKSRRKPFLLLNASAIGYYGPTPHVSFQGSPASPAGGGQPPKRGGPHGEEGVNEEAPAGSDFLARACQAWEAEAIRAEDFGLRVIRLRIGIVLEKSGGALAKMLPPFKTGLGGPLGSGRQWMSWIHLQDLIGLIHLILEKKEIRGVVNGTAPSPVTMKEFAAGLGRALKRPAFFPVPGFIVKILLGEMSDVLLKGERVLPKRALEAGYVFKFPTLEAAFKEILRR